MNEGFSGLSVFVSVAGRLLDHDDLNIQSVDIHDVDEGDNEVEIKCLDNDYKIADSSLFRVSQILAIRFGYTAGEMSEERSGYVIMKPATNYAHDGVLSKITALTKSATLGARRSQKSYGPTSVRTIVSEIAQRNNLKLDIKGGDERLDGFSHGTWTDRQVLRVLADRFAYQLSYLSDTIVFAPRDYGLAPKLELLYSSGEESTILHADLNVDVKKSDGGDVQTTATTVNPMTKESTTVGGGEAAKALAISAENGHTWVTSPVTQPLLPPAKTKTVSAAPGTVEGIELGFTNFFDPTDIKTLLSTPDTVEGNALAHATSEKLKRQKKKGELSIVSIGMPSARARMLVHVRGLAKRDSGNWYVSSVTHKIDKHEGYTCHWELNRHGNNTQGGEKTKSPLNSQSANTNESKQVIAVSADTGSISTVRNP